MSVCMSHIHGTSWVCRPLSAYLRTCSGSKLNLVSCSSDVVWRTVMSSSHVISIEETRYTDRYTIGGRRWYAITSKYDSCVNGHIVLAHLYSKPIKMAPIILWGSASATMRNVFDCLAIYQYIWACIQTQDLLRIFDILNGSWATAWLGDNATTDHLGLQYGNSGRVSQYHKYQINDHVNGSNYAIMH